MKTPWSFVGKNFMRKTPPHLVLDSYMKKAKLEAESTSGISETNNNKKKSAKNCMTPNDDMGL